MQCREFEDRLNLLLDERQPPEADAPLSAHAVGCEPCGQLLAGQRVLLAGLRQGKVPFASANFSQRVVASSVAQPMAQPMAKARDEAARDEAAEAVVLESRTSRRRGAWLVAAGLLTAAAAALIAVSVAAWNASVGNGAGQANVVKNSVETPKKLMKVQPLVAQANPSERRGPRAGSPRPFQPSALSLLRPQGGYGVAIAEAASNLPDAVERLDEVERYAPGIRPIRVSFTMLLQAFWRAIPGNGASNGTGNSADDPAAMQSTAAACWCSRLALEGRSFC